MINSNLFDYVDVLDRAADASWLRNEAISNNIANVDTPEYKRQDVDFESALRTELSKFNYMSLDQKIRRVELSHLEVGTYTDYPGFSYRLDDNNVDIDQENVFLAENTLVYQGLTESVSQEIDRIKSVCK